ncbi:hypothetical protein SRABI84_02041 [Peribacillus simplex]|nr:hypothetical protein SRABI84_02041 [Peribacillus simplex]
MIFLTIIVAFVSRESGNVTIDPSDDEGAYDLKKKSLFKNKMQCQVILNKGFW